MNHVVLSALLPVMALILLGLAIGRARWLGPVAVRRLSTLAFMVLTPILLFRAMSRVHVAQLDLLPALVYALALALALVFAGKNLRAALLISGIKNLVLPLLAALLGWAFGMSGVPLAVMITTAALPVGANAFMFSQRYGLAQETVTAAVAVSTALSALTVTLVLLLVMAP